MPTSSQTTDPSTTNFKAIFEAASNEYKTLTGQGLETHPFAALEDYISPNSVLNVFRKQALACDTFCKGDDKLMAWLTPIVYILFSVSETLGKGISLTLLAAIGVLLGVVKDDIASYEALVNQFERIHLFLRRLDHCTFTPKVMELLAKIMAQILSILAISTKAIKETRIKKFMKKVVGKTEVEDALQILDLLTKEENLTMMTARDLEDTDHFDDEATIFEETFQDVSTTQEVFCNVGSDVNETNLDVIKRDLHSVNDNIKATKPMTGEHQWNQSREKLRTWLSPPNPSINHNAACDSQHDGTAKWFMRGNTFNEWKKNGSLLWIRGNPGSGKSVLCSAIIKDIKQMRISRSALVAYYYFDFMDAAKRNIRGLLTSLLLQLVNDSDICWNLLSQLHKACHDGSEQPSEAALVQCLKGMLDLLGQSPTYLIMDALDECPNSTGTPSARDKVLNFVEDLVKSSHPNLFICITSRPEQDITNILNPLASPSRCVSLHEEVGQREDINDYIRSFIQSDRAMRRWRTEDKELVTNVLTEQAKGMFRWVYYQLDNLRRCMPSSIREILNELPADLDDTYERILLGIPKQLRRHAYRLFQCMVAASRPLRVEELAEIITIEFGLAGALSVVVKGWRPANPEEVVLSACSTLISIIIDEKGSKVVQFSHLSVKEFLTSDRIQTTDVGKISQFYIALEPAHTLLARLCLTVLLQLDEKVDKIRLARFPLAFYAAQHWVDHANFGNVASQIQDAMERLFNPKKPHFRTWIWLRRSANKQTMENIDERPPPPKLTPLYYAAFFGFGDLARRLIVTHKENVNFRSINEWTPLHAASDAGHVGAARVLLDYGACMNARRHDGWTPLHSASRNGHLKVVQLLLEHRAASNSNTRTNLNHPLCLASRSGHLEVVRLFLDHGAEVNIEDERNWSPYEEAKNYGQHDVARLLRDRGAK